MMGFFDFVKEHDLIWSPPDGFRELAAFLVPDVPRGRSDEAAHAVPFHVLRHVQPNHCPFVVEKELRQCFRQFCFADSRGPQEEERTDGPVLVTQPRPCPTHRIRDGRNSFVLPDDTFVKPFFHVEELFHFAFHQPAYRNSRPLADDPRNVLLFDFLVQHLLVSLNLCELILRPCNFRLDAGEFAILDSSRELKLPCPARTIEFCPSFFRLLLQLFERVDDFLLFEPVRFQSRTFLL
ncbi:MAG: hypothetical protein BWY06_02422 [Candidatus Latescibacteria bacterium ADurb.Bin168]|nr:MAG: hypothetical protein BWY06_02422 [Candidatus Latescibacteria bacterium ADurb.Bin168]